MICAIADGRKTQTRRIAHDMSRWRNADVGDCLFIKEKVEAYRGPGGKVRLKYPSTGKTRYIKRPTNGGIYRTDRPLFMKRVSAQIWLKLLNVRRERLQSISPEDVYREGISIDHKDPLGLPHPSGVGGDMRLDFARAWDQINGRDAWRADPDVFVLTFELMERPDE